MKLILMMMVVLSSFADDLMLSSLKEDSNLIDVFPVSDKRTFYVLKSKTDNNYIFSLNDSLGESFKDRKKEDSKVVTSFSYDLGETLFWSYGPSFPCLYKQQEVLAIFEKKAIKERDDFHPIEAYTIDKNSNIFTRVKSSEVNCRWRPKAGDVFPKIWLQN
ncbi:hypothetical protein [Bacteriovorax sp. Seq25_V]|uniref:hypothetical protein n=1 Tax=Bacteriovorax sp. Seq25_V TaxID=1201288 RepID=UPI000389E4CF|nr:hypothetical protein [Bacteriovorax sp. Seq25_V]EQC43759.1 hypothetical protein M900_1246 [Bacteriovorax sp. Seq25_V]